MVDDDCVALNDGTSVFLLNDGTSCILLNTQIEEAQGVTIEGTHAVPLVGPRAEQLLPVEFSFILRSCLITRTKLRICVKSSLTLIIQASLKFKSALLLDAKYHTKIKSATLVREVEKIGIKSTTLVKEVWRTGIFANAKNKKLKEVLLRKLREMLDDG